MVSTYVLKMRSKFFAYLSSIFLAVTSPAFADFGDADFPIDFFDKSPKSYHDVWCREMEIPLDFKSDVGRTIDNFS